MPDNTLPTGTLSRNYTESNALSLLQYIKNVRAMYNIPEDVSIEDALSSFPLDLHPRIYPISADTGSGNQPDDSQCHHYVDATFAFYPGVPGLDEELGQPKYGIRIVGPMKSSTPNVGQAESADSNGDENLNDRMEGLILNTTQGVLCRASARWHDYWATYTCFYDPETETASNFELNQEYPARFQDFPGEMHLAIDMSERLMKDCGENGCIIKHGRTSNTLIWELRSRDGSPLFEFEGDRMRV